MKLQAIAAAALLALGAQGASAVHVTSSTTSLGTIDNSVQLIGNSFDATVHSFFDNYTFTLLGTNSVGTTPVVFNLGTFYSLANVMLQLAGPTSFGPQSVSPSTFNNYSLGNLGAGSYQLTLTGDRTGSLGGGYGGSLSATTIAPIPEPETLAMMLAGLGAIGFMVRRRNVG